MAKSAVVSAGDDATATQYNNVRTDALNLRALAGAATISGGVITVTADYSYYVVSAESGTTDDLDTVTAGTGIATGDMVMLIADAGDYIKLTAAGNLDRVMYLTGEHTAVIRYNGTSWDVVRGSGCGYKRVWIPATAFTPLNTAGCGAVQELDLVKVRSFNASTDESAVIGLSFPSGWSGIIKAKVRWMVNDANAGNVIWSIKTENAAAGEVMGNAATTAFAASAAGETQYEVSETAVCAAHTAGDDGESINLTIFRDADNGSDNYASLAYLIGVDLYYLMYNDGIEEV